MKLGAVAVAILLTAPLVAQDRDLFTNVYVVPPAILAAEGAVAIPAADPFAAPVIQQDQGDRPTAKSILQNAGITFGVGASAIYNPATSQLIVRNTQDQMELVEAYVDSIRAGVEKQMYLKIRVANLDGLAETDDVFKLLRPEAPNCAPAPPTFDFPESFLSKLADKAEPAIGVSREFIWTFKEERTAAIFESLEKKEAARLSEPVTAMCRSGNWIVVEPGERTVGISAVLGADEFTIDVHTFLPSSAKPFEADIVNGHTVPDGFSDTILDGQTVAISEKGPGESFDVIFVTALIVDAAGIPIRTPYTRSHVVAAGETLEEISARYGVEPATIREKNRALDGNVTVGKILVIPSAMVPDPAEPNPAIEQALKRIILPNVNFAGTKFSDALGVLKNESLRLTEGTGTEIPKFLLRGVEEISDEPITLRLRNVPLSEALRYTTNLAGCKFVIEGDSVVVVPLESN